MSTPELNPATPSFQALLESRLPPKAFVEFADHYGREDRGLFRCKDALIVAPSNVEEVSFVVSCCCRKRVPVVPFGGGTGLVGGQVGFDLPRPVVLSMHRMNQIRKIDPAGNTITVEAGCTLEEVRRAAEREQRLFPLSIASNGTCHIGGNLATNAGGVHVIRYGNMRDLCLGVESVFPDGQVWSELSALRKDNSGYDLRNLLIGSEGTLSVFTAATLKLFQQLKSESAALLVLRDIHAAIELLDLFRDRFGSMLSAFELLSGTGFRFLKETGLKSRLPIQDNPEWVVLVDIGSELDLDVDKILWDASEEAFNRGVAVDGVFAVSGAQRQEFWDVRELFPEGNRRIGAIASHDISVPISKVPEFILRATAALAGLGKFRTNCFGHVGDGNLHFNVFSGTEDLKAEQLSMRDEVTEAVHTTVRELGGSTTAEHGTGRAKSSELYSFGAPTFLSMIRRIKNVLDPRSIMNPGAVIPFGQLGQFPAE